jgi:hypothetical protein
VVPMRSVDSCRIANSGSFGRSWTMTIDLSGQRQDGGCGNPVVGAVGLCHPRGVRPAPSS